MITSRVEAVNSDADRESLAFIFVAQYANLTTFVPEC